MNATAISGPRHTAFEATIDGVCRAEDLRRRRPRPEPPLATDIAAFDGLLGGGLAWGALTEIVGRPSAGRFAILLATLQRVTSSGRPAALVDQGGHLDPRSAAAAGIDLERLLWARPERLPDTLAAAELLVATGFPLVVVDLGLPPVRGRAPLAAWIRLARRAAERSAVALVGAPYRVSACAARAVVVAEGSRGRWAGRPGEVRTLAGTRAGLRLAKNRNHHDERRAQFVLTLPEAALGLTPVEDIATTQRKESSHVQSR